MIETKNSLFADHLEIFEVTDIDQLSKDQQKEYKRIEQLSLPPLKWPSEKKKVSPPEWLDLFFRPQNLGLIFAAALSVMVFINVIKQSQPDLRAKGSARISLYYEREAKVFPLSEKVVLKNGDKVGASVISAKSGSAYWAIVDSKSQLLISNDEVLASEIKLKPGIREDFKSSFTLTAPNEGEQLVVIVCESKYNSSMALKEVSNINFVNEVIKTKSLTKHNCMYMGRVLRRVGEP